MHAMSVGILKYFTLKRRSSLPSLDGPLSKVILREYMHEIFIMKVTFSRRILILRLNGIVLHYLYTPMLQMEDLFTIVTKPSHKTIHEKIT